MASTRVLSKEEFKLLNAATLSDLDELAKVDISKLSEDKTFFVETALQKKNFLKLQCYLSCKNIQKEISRLLSKKSEYEKIYFEFLLSLQNKDDYDAAFSILTKTTDANWIVPRFNRVLNSIFTFIEKRNYESLESLLKFREIHPKLKETKRFEDKLSRTPLEYAHKRRDGAASQMILTVLTKDNPYAQAVQNNEIEKLQDLVKDLKFPADPKTQEKLQIAGICLQIKKLPEKFGETLLNAGLLIYPVSPYYRVSILHGALTLAENHPEEAVKQIPFIKACLEKLKEQIPDETQRKDALLEIYDNTNLLECAYKTNNNQIISMMTDAGAKLPQITEVGVKITPSTKIVAQPTVMNLLILCIEQNNLKYFCSNIESSSIEQLQEVAIYCVKNYSDVLTPFLLALLTNKQSRAAIDYIKGKSLIDIALELKNMTLVTWLASQNLEVSTDHGVDDEKKSQTNITTIDNLCELVKIGKKDQLEKLLLLPECQKLISKRSLEGLTLTEIAVIYEKYDIFALLANRKDYHYLDGVFNIISEDCIKTLLSRYNNFKYIKFTNLLKNILSNQPKSDFSSFLLKHVLNDRTQPTSSSFSLFQKKSFRYDADTLKPLLLAIANDQLSPETLTKLAKKEGFKEKIINFLHQLITEHEEEFISLLSNEDKRGSFAKFFGVARGFAQPTVERGALAEFTLLMKTYHLKKPTSDETYLPREVEIEQYETEGLYHLEGMVPVDPFRIGASRSLVPLPSAPFVDSADLHLMPPSTISTEHVETPLILSPDDSRVTMLSVVPTVVNLEKLPDEPSSALSQPGSIGKTNMFTHNHNKQKSTVADVAFKPKEIIL